MNDRHIEDKVTLIIDDLWRDLGYTDQAGFVDKWGRVNSYEDFLCYYVALDGKESGSGVGCGCGNGSRDGRGKGSGDANGWEGDEPPNDDWEDD